MFRLVIFVIYIFYYETELVTARHDALEFWSGYKSNNARRTLKDPGIANTTDQNLKFRFIKPSTAKAETITNKGKKNIKLSNVTGPAPGEVSPSMRIGVNSYNKPVKTDSKKSYWDGVLKPWLRQREDDQRSIMMNPLYLRQDDSKDDDGETAENANETSSFLAGWLNPYSIRNDMLELANLIPEANISVEVIGRTAEYNDIVLMKVTEVKSDLPKYFRAEESKYIDEVAEKKIIFIVHGLSVMGFEYLHFAKMEGFKTLLSFYFNHLDKFDIYMIPLANPDGYRVKQQFSRNNLWNKNMSPQSACPGVALDRNFDVRFNLSHTISSCSQHFPGATPFSEPETKAIREVLHHYSQKMVAYFHVHAGSYDINVYKGDAVLYPKGYTEVQSDDDRYIDLHGEIDEAMKNAGFQVISVPVDTLHNWYGKVTGTSVDYASTIYGIPYSLELVMQPYFNRYSAIAFRKIWSVVINATITNVWRNVKNNDV